MNISYGFELELSDIDRSIDIPLHLGRWEGPKEDGYYMGAELDIVNTTGQYKGVASDPLCQVCPVGGEINVSPSNTIESQFSKVVDIIKLFPVVGSGHVNHFHVHTYFKELEDESSLKKLIRYVIDNESDIIYNTYLQNWNRIEFTSATEWGRTYLLQDGGRYLNKQLHNIDDKSIDEIKQLLALPSYYYDDGQLKESTSIRTAVNFSNLIKNKTLEFRCFRSTLDLSEVVSQLHFVTDLIVAGLTDHKPVKQILAENNYRFANLLYDDDNQKGWESTRFEKGRGDRYKYYFDSSMPVNDYVSEQNIELFDTLTKLVKK